MLEVDAAEEVDPATEEEAEAVADDEADDDEPEPEVGDAEDVDDRSMVALDRVTEATAHC